MKLPLKTTWVKLRTDSEDVLNLTIDDIDQIIVFINQVNRKIGFNIRSFDYELKQARQ